jgi:glycosyltransferase involved in cell wall biosynthesis
MVRSWEPGFPHLGWARRSNDTVAPWEPARVSVAAGSGRYIDRGASGCRTGPPWVCMSQRIRIAYLLDAIDNPVRGTVNHVRRLTHTLDRNEFFAHVLVMAGDPSDHRPAGFHCHVEHLGHTPGNPVSALRMRLRLQRYLREHPCDVVCAYDVTARAVGLPVARSVHKGLCIGVARDMGHQLQPRDLVRLRRANEIVNRFVASSSAVAQRLMRQEHVFRDWIDIIPEAAHLDDGVIQTSETKAEARHSFGLSLHQPVLFVYDAFEPWTDRATLFETLDFLAEHHPDIRCVMAGRGPQAVIDSVRADAQRRAMGRNIVIADDPHLHERWMLAADAAVIASLYEGPASAVLHCMALGLPVVATATGESPEVIVHGQTGYLVSPREADAMAMRIHLLLVADDLGREFSMAARDSVRHEFSDTLEARRFADYFRTLVYSQIPRAVQTL